jgi:glyoxylase-like metal-dependent hydrolase (beta-lactamase superfamily II)
MKVRASSNNLFQLTQLVAFNCYLLREDDGFTLIDTNMSGQAQAIMREANKLGLPIVRILLTHAHVDHVGSLDALHAALPHAQVVCTTKPTRLLHEGDRIGSLEVIATPGHTPGHVAFLDTRDRTVIAGDAFQTQGGVAVSGTFELLFPLPALATWHKGLAQESARKLLALQPSLLAVGHGRMLSHPQAAMEHAIRVMEESLAKEERKRPRVA